MPLHTYVQYSNVSKMHLKLTWVTKLFMMWKLNQKLILLWIYMKIDMSFCICKYMKFLLDWDLRSLIRLCIRPNNLNGKGWINICKLCLAQNNIRTLCGMFMKSWAILTFVVNTNINDKNAMICSIVCLSICWVTKCTCVFQHTSTSFTTIAHHGIDY